MVREAAGALGRGIEVVRSGMHDTVQDRGRFGYQALGLAITIHLGRIDDLRTGFNACLQRLNLHRTLSRIISHVPGAQTDCRQHALIDRNGLHDSSSFPISSRFFKHITN